MANETGDAVFNEVVRISADSEQFIQDLQKIEEEWSQSLARMAQAAKSAEGNPISTIAASSNSGIAEFKASLDTLTTTLTTNFQSLATAIGTSMDEVATHLQKVVDKLAEVGKGAKDAAATASNVSPIEGTSAASGESIPVGGDVNYRKLSDEDQRKAFDNLRALGSEAINLLNADQLRWYDTMAETSAKTLGKQVEDLQKLKDANKLTADESTADWQRSYQIRQEVAEKFGTYLEGLPTAGGRGIADSFFGGLAKGSGLDEGLSGIAASIGAIIGQLGLWLIALQLILGAFNAIKDVIFAIPNALQTGIEYLENIQQKAVELGAVMATAFKFSDNQSENITAGFDAAKEVVQELQEQVVKLHLNLDTTLVAYKDFIAAGGAGLVHTPQESIDAVLLIERAIKGITSDQRLSKIIQTDFAQLIEGNVSATNKFLEVTHMTKEEWFKIRDSAIDHKDLLEQLRARTAALAAAGDRLPATFTDLKAELNLMYQIFASHIAEDTFDQLTQYARQFEALLVEHKDELTSIGQLIGVAVGAGLQLLAAFVQLGQDTHSLREAFGELLLPLVSVLSVLATMSNNLTYQLQLLSIMSKVDLKHPIESYKNAIEEATEAQKKFNKTQEGIDNLADKAGAAALGVQIEATSRELADAKRIAETLKPGSGAFVGPKSLLDQDTSGSPLPIDKDKSQVTEAHKDLIALLEKEKLEHDDLREKARQSAQDQVGDANAVSASHAQVTAEYKKQLQEQLTALQEHRNKVANLHSDPVAKQEELDKTDNLIDKTVNDAQRNIDTETRRARKEELTDRINDYHELRNQIEANAAHEISVVKDQVANNERSAEDGRVAQKVINDKEYQDLLDLLNRKAAAIERLRPTSKQFSADDEAANAQKIHDAEKLALDRQATAEVERLQKDATRAALAETEARESGILQLIKRSVSEQHITLEEGLSREIEIAESAHYRKIEILESEYDAAKTTKERKQRIKEDENLEDIRYTNQFKQLVSEREKAAKDETDRLNSLAQQQFRAKQITPLQEKIATQQQDQTASPAQIHDETVQLLKNEIAGLNSALEIAKNRLTDLSNQEARLVAETKEAETADKNAKTAEDAARQAVDNARQKLRDLVAQGIDPTSAAYQEQKAKLDEAKAALDQNKAKLTELTHAHQEAEQKLADLQATSGSTADAIEKQRLVVIDTTTELDNFKRKLKDTDVSNVEKGLDAIFGKEVIEKWKGNADHASTAMDKVGAAAEIASAGLKLITGIISDIKQGEEKGGTLGGIGAGASSVGSVLSETGIPQLEVAGAVLKLGGQIVSMFGGMFKAAAAAIAEEVKKEFDVIVQKIQDNAETLGQGIKDLQAEKEEAITRLSNKKGGQDELAKLLPEFDKEINQLKNQQRQIIDNFNDQVTILKQQTDVGQKWLSDWKEINKQVKQYLDAGGNPNTAAQFLNEKLASETLDLQNQYNDAEQAAIKDAFSLNDMLDQRVKLQESIVKNADAITKNLDDQQKIMDQIAKLSASENDSIVRRQAGAITAAQEFKDKKKALEDQLTSLKDQNEALKQQAVDNQKQLTDLNYSIDLQTIRVQKEKEVFGLTSDIASLHRLDEQLSLEALDQEVAKWKEMKSLIDNLKNGTTFDPSNLLGVTGPKASDFAAQISALKAADTKGLKDNSHNTTIPEIETTIGQFQTGFLSLTDTLAELKQEKADLVRTATDKNHRKALADVSPSLDALIAQLTKAAANAPTTPPANQPFPDAPGAIPGLTSSTPTATGGPATPIATANVLTQTLNTQLDALTTKVQTTSTQSTSALTTTLNTQLAAVSTAVTAGSSAIVVKLDQLYKLPAAPVEGLSSTTQKIIDAIQQGYKLQHPGLTPAPVNIVVQAVHVASGVDPYVAGKQVGGGIVDEFNYRYRAGIY